MAAITPQPNLDRDVTALPGPFEHLSVTIVVVTDGRTEYVDDTLAAAAAQCRPTDRLFVVDVAPTDDGGSAMSAAIAEMALATPAPITIVNAPHARTFGAAVKAGLAADLVGSANTNRHAAWLWLLHDDAAPMPGALNALLEAVDLSPSVALAGPKQLDWTGEYLRDVGIRTSRFGRRVHDLDDDEVDQGQYDDRSDVLGVGTAGMLIRRDVWDQLRGTDPALGPFGDGLDLSRRARLAGHRVILAPGAAVRHARASYAGLRGSDRRVGARRPADPNRSFGPRRRAFVHSQLVAVPLPLLPFVAVAAVVSGVVRALRRIATKEPGLVATELAEPWRAMARVRAILGARRQARRTSTLPRRTLRPLQATWRDVWRVGRDHRLQRRALRGHRRLPNQLELAELHRRSRRRRLMLALVVLAIIATTVAIVKPLLTPSAFTMGLAGGGLLPTDMTTTGVWSAATSGWAGTGLGNAALGDPLWIVLAGLAVLTGGSVQLAVTVLVLAALLLAGLGAWFAAGAATHSVLLRAWAATSWVAAPAVLAGLMQGRLSIIMAAAALPWAVLGVARAVGAHRGAARAIVLADEVPDSRSGSVSAAAAAGLALAVACSGVPALFIMAVVAIIVVAIVSPGRRWRLALVLAPGAAALAPTFWAALRQPRLLAAMSGNPIAAPAPTGWQALLGFPAPPVGAGLGPDVTIAGVSLPVLPVAAAALTALVAVVLMFRRGRSGAGARLGVVIAAVGGCVACGLSAVVVGAGETSTVAGWAGIGALVVSLGTITAVAVGADGAWVSLSTRSFSWRQPVVAIGSVALVSVPLVLAIAGVRGGDLLVRPVTAQASSSVVPAVAVEAASSSDRTRTAVIVPGDSATSVTAQILRGSAPDLLADPMIVTARSVTGSLTSPMPSTPDAATRSAAQAIADLVATTQDTSSELAALDVGFVIVPPVSDDTAGTRTQLVQHLSAVPGLERIGENATGTLYRVAPAGDTGADGGQRVARVRVLDADGRQLAAVASGRSAVDAEIPANNEASLVTLAERADVGWQAWLDGRPLRAVPAPDGWSQAFAIPPTGGDLVIRYHTVATPIWVWLMAIAFGVVALAAIPTRRRRNVSVFGAALPAEPVEMPADDAEGASVGGAADEGAEPSTVAAPDETTPDDGAPDDTESDAAGQLVGSRRAKRARHTAGGRR